MSAAKYRFRLPMDKESIAARLDAGTLGPYAIAATAAGHQSGFTVDHLARKIRAQLPGFIARLAAEVEAENEARNAS